MIDIKTKISQDKYKPLKNTNSSVINVTAVLKSRRYKILSSEKEAQYDKLAERYNNLFHKPIVNKVFGYLTSKVFENNRKSKASAEQSTRQWHQRWQNCFG